ncbi:MAG: hypothetical protein N2C14_21545, partial [Planctomycetales bacterium]
AGIGFLQPILRQRADVNALKALGGDFGFRRSRFSLLPDVVGPDWFPEIARAYLANSKVTDQTMSRLQRMKQLELLDLSGTQVTDKGLAHLQELTQLKELRLNGTRITDKGLARLQALDQLELLVLSHSQVTDGAVAELQKALPNCHIIRFPIPLPRWNC